MDLTIKKENVDFLKKIDAAICEILIFWHKMAAKNAKIHDSGCLFGPKNKKFRYRQLPITVSAFFDE